jgi:hypothetical protein
LDVSERAVRVVVRDPNKSHDEMLDPERSRRCNLGKWYRERKLVMSTLDPRALSSTNDSTLIDLVSPLLVMEEMMELKAFALARLR